MAYYYQPVNGTVPSGMTVVADGSGFYARSSLTAVSPPSHLVRPMAGHPIGAGPASAVVFPSTPVYGQSLVSPAPSYHIGMRPTMVTPSTMSYQTVGLAAPLPGAAVTQVMPRHYLGRTPTASAQQGIPFMVGGAGMVSSSGLYSIPSYSFSPTGMYQYPTISSSFHHSPMAPAYQHSMPSHIRVPLVAIGHPPSVVNSNVPRATYRP